MNIMSREKKSKVDDVGKLRKILDNSSDPKTKALISTDEKALESVRRRLAGETLKITPHYNHSIRAIDPFEPKVTIHPKIVESPRLITPLPRFTPSTILTEFKSVYPPPPTKPFSSQKLPFITQELYEVEKINEILPEPTDNSYLPEWQPVEETQPTEHPISPEKLAIDHVPEFERSDIPIESENEEKAVDWEPLPPKQEPTETLVQFTAVESPEPQPQKLSKKQEREAKKIQKTKEKEAKRQKKLELKKLKREIRNKEREAKQIITEQQDIQQIPEKQIKKEIEQKTKIPTKKEFVPIKQKRDTKKLKKKQGDSAEWESYSVKKTLTKPSIKSICTYKGYTLYEKETGKYRGKKTTIHFFSKEKPDLGHSIQLPNGYQVAVNNKTGVPYLKKKK
jgi:hypothetical protein